MNVTLHIDGNATILEQVVRAGNILSFSLNGTTHHFRSHALPGGNYVLERQVAEGVWQRMSGAVWQHKNTRYVELAGRQAKISERTSGASHASGQAPLSPLSPMPGIVRQIFVKAGDAVEAGQALVLMEAMKLQITLSAGAAGVVEAVRVHVGEMVDEGKELVSITPLPKKDVA